MNQKQTESIQEECPKCHGLMVITQKLYAVDPKTGDSEATIYWTCFDCRYWEARVRKDN